MIRKRLNTHTTIRRIILALPLLLLAACVATAGAIPTAPATATPLAEVPRNRTLILAALLHAPIGVTNPWCSLGYTHQEGNSLLWEGLAYYAIFADRDIPWLAQSMDYTQGDFTELTIKLNPLARWSDGQPVTAEDVVFTFDGQMHDETLPYHANFTQFVESYQALDTQTVVIRFKMPAPRFKFEVLTLKMDTGLPIVPAHALRSLADIHAFAGGFDLPHSGPYRLVAWDANQKIYDLRPDWWAAQAGLAPLPSVQRVIFVSLTQPMDTIAQRAVNNEFDATLVMTGPLIASVLQDNPKITSYTGDQPPYGNLDWWPNSLWMNTQLAPYNDARVRRALSLVIDRDKLNQVLYGGAAIATIYPFPLYPALQRFADSAPIKALEAQYQPGRFDLAESARLMTAAGFSRNADGLWAKDGETFNAQVNGFDSIHNDIAPVLAEMFQQAGFDSAPYLGQDVNSRMVAGAAGLYLFGHGASLVDPYAVFDLFHSRHNPAAGQPAAIDFARYNDPAYDQIVDGMAALSADDPRFQTLAAQAMEIYWREVIDIPVTQWLNRIPYNQTYWTNWPTADNPAMGTNGGFWSLTAPLVVAGLKPAP
ncbi:MAG: ABC transporter substrate-binding protein [Anaerolineales bacterium]